MNNTKVAAYCRVSTDLSDQLHSLAAQIKYFTEYISEHDGWDLVEVYYDEGITGTSVKKRDAFNRMISDCENGKIELIITKEVSRFARNTVDTLCFTRKLTALGIRVIFMNDGIDTSDKDGELRLTIMASIAQEESRKISERVKWGIRRKMENGWVYGFSEMFGYRIHKGEIEIEPDEAEVVKRIFHSYVYEGKGCHTIANELNAAGLLSVRGKMWREDGVCRILKNDKYVGDLTQWKHYTTDFLTKTVLQNNVGCDNHAINEVVPEVCMKHILEYIQFTRSSITERQLENVSAMQALKPKFDPEPLKAEIEALNNKKRKAIDLMLDELITKEELKQQTAYYDEEISKLSETIASGQNVAENHKRQLDTIKNYISLVNQTAEMDTDSTKVYGEMLKRVLVYDNCMVDIYLNCMPTGFRVKFHVNKFNQQHPFNVFIDSCEAIPS